MTTPSIPTLTSVPINIAVTEPAAETGIKPELLAKAQLVLQSITSGHQQLSHRASGLELIIEGKNPIRTPSNNQTIAALPSGNNLALILAAIEPHATSSKIDKTTLDQLIIKLTDQLTVRSAAQPIILKGSVVQVTSAQVEIRIPNQSQTLFLPLKSVTPLPQAGDSVIVTLRPPAQPGGAWHAQLTFDTQANNSRTTPINHQSNEHTPTATQPLKHKHVVESGKSSMVSTIKHTEKVVVPLSQNQTSSLLSAQLNASGLSVNSQKLAAPLSLASSRIPVHNQGQAVSPIIHLSTQRQQLTVSITTVDPLAKLALPMRSESLGTYPAAPVAAKLIQQQVHSSELAQALGFRKLEASATKGLNVLQVIEARGLNITPIHAPSPQILSTQNESKQTLPQVLLAHIQSRYSAAARIALSHSSNGVADLAPLMQALSNTSGLVSEQTGEWLAIWRKNLRPPQDILFSALSQSRQPEMSSPTKSLDQRTQQMHNQLAKILAANSDSNTSTVVGKPSDNSATAESPLIHSLKQLLSAPSSPISAASLVSPVQNQGFIGALISLLQLTLAGRAIRQQPNLTKLVEQASKELTRSVGSMPSPQQATPRTLLDMAQLDNRHNLLNQLRTLLAGHQQQKMRHAEQMLQGQETFYYVLPTTDSKQAPHELLIRREPQREDKKQQKTDAKRQWQLTMKLSIGKMGELLAKSRIVGDELDLDIYTSTDELLNKVRDTLPFLLRRFESLGLSVNHKQVQRGKIPAHLDERPYHILETQA